MIVSSVEIVVKIISQKSPIHNQKSPKSVIFAFKLTQIFEKICEKIVKYGVFIVFKTFTHEGTLL